MDQAEVKQNLKNLGISDEEIRVYLSLLERGPSTTTQIAKNASIPKTTVYRLVEEMLKKNLVDKVVGARGMIIEASDPEQISLLLKKKEEKILNLKQAIPSVIDTLRSLQASPRHTTQVSYYEGKKGVQQLIWNSLKSKEPLRSFGYRSLKEAVGIEFLVKWWDESGLRGQSHRMLANPETYKLKDAADEGAKIKFAPKPEGFFRRRYFTKKELPILTETFIYDDTFAIIQWKEDDVCGVEICNRTIADQEKFVFDKLWRMGKKYRG